MFSVFLSFWNVIQESFCLQSRFMKRFCNIIHPDDFKIFSILSWGKFSPQSFFHYTIHYFPWKYVLIALSLNPQQNHSRISWWLFSAYIHCQKYSLQSPLEKMKITWNFVVKRNFKANSKSHFKAISSRREI